MITDKFYFFYGTIFSQWCYSIFDIDGIEYNSAEQYFMAKKALMFHDIEAYEKIMMSEDPAYQKAIGKQVKKFNKVAWQKVCRKVVYDANYAKFSQNPDMLKELIATGDRLLVELIDNIYGCGLEDTDPRIYDESQWLGSNWLGYAITKVRDDLRFKL